MPSFEAIDWQTMFRGYRSSANEEPGSEASRKMWDAKAPSFARKPKRSGYIAQLIAYIENDLAPEDSVLDFGCGSGTLAIPLAQKGHWVQAADFSGAMLAELTRNAEYAGVSERISVVQKSWQESWDGIDMADIAISSRSLITDDLGDAVSKLETHARKRVFVTVGAGDLPWSDRRIWAALGHANQAQKKPPYELAALVNYLFSQGKLPQIHYISVPEPWHRASKDELEEAIRFSHTPANEQEECLLDAYLKKHITYNEHESRFELDYPRINQWACVDWAVN